jgi:enoyl-CoA hydratase
MAVSPPSDRAITDPNAGGSVELTIDGDVARIALDDGKANSLSPAVVDALSAAVARAQDEARAIAVVGREGCFCAGFDLRTMRSEPDKAKSLMEAGSRLAVDLYLSRVPVVFGCTGHALAMGAVLLLTADARIGAQGSFKVGFNEVAIGLAMPRFAVELARDRLAPTHLTDAVQLARIYDPDGAVAAGLLDELAPPQELVDRTVERARHLAGSLDPRAFQATRTRVRGEIGKRLLDMTRRRDAPAPE